MSQNRRSTPSVSFLEPSGEAALCQPDSISWQVFRNPVALYIGGITATVLELAEPRIRAGVWENTSFKDNPLRRLKRTGLAAMVTVYGATSTAEKMIAGITQMHQSIKGTTAQGQQFTALDPDLMNWVHATASFGFSEAYHQFVTRLDDSERDSFYAEALPSATLYGAPSCPDSQHGIKVMFTEMHPKLGSTEVNEHFLQIMRTTPALPKMMRPFQSLFVKAAIDILPDDKKATLGFDSQYHLSFWERKIIQFFGRLTDKIIINNSPAVQACERLGLPRNYLWKL